MSYKIYEKALKRAKKCEDYDCGSKHSTATIEKAEMLLNLRLSPQVKDYLSRFGYIEFFGVELYGIIDENFTLDKNTFEGCMIEWTVNERENNNLNPNWVALKFEDDGEMAFLDFENINAEGEPRVIIAIDEGEGYTFKYEIAEDFGEYLSELVDEAE